MEQKIYELLLSIQQGMKEMQEDISGIKLQLNRIEISQQDDVIALLKKQQADAAVTGGYLEKRITEVDKKVYVLERRIDN